MSRLAAEARACARQWRRRASRSPPPRRGAVVLGLACLAAMALLGWLFDAQAALLARQLPYELNRIFAAITRIGDSGYVFALSAFAVVAPLLAASPLHSQQVRAGLRQLAGRASLIFAVTATSGLASQIIKQCVGRARPRLMDSLGAFHFDPFSLRAAQASFPSGHTITVFALAWTLGLFLPKLRPYLFALACLVGVSRIMVGAHYPSDVMAGALVGVVAAWATCRAFAARRLAIEFIGRDMAPRGQGLVLSSLRALAGAGKARAGTRDSRTER